MVAKTNATASSGLRNSILGNAIYSNVGLGIDLDNNAVTLNDLNDPDTGANNRQNFPVITLATTSSGSTTIQGTLNSTANTMFRLEFFANPTADPTGFGEGKTFLGSTIVTTDSSNNASFSVVLATSVPIGQFLSSTATDATGNTSEFSGSVTINVGVDQSLIVTPTSLSVTEGSTNTFTVKLAAQPAESMTVNVARVSGDTDLSVSGGVTLTFTTANWNTPQTVTLAAAEDADTVNGSATFTVSSTGLTDVDVTASEVDNDTDGSPPTDIGLSNSTVAENAGANAVIGTLSANDSDASETFTFSLPTGLDDNAKFNINGDSLRANAPFDFEAKSSYKVTVRVTDSIGLTFDK